VLVLLPTDSNKLLLQWKGSFEVLEKVRGDDYKIQLTGRTKMFHANMLKKYFERNQEVSEKQTDPSVQQLSAVRMRMRLEVRLIFARLCRKRRLEMSRSVRIYLRVRDRKS